MVRKGRRGLALLAAMVVLLTLYGCSSVPALKLKGGLERSLDYQSLTGETVLSVNMEVPEGVDEEISVVQHFLNGLTLNVLNEVNQDRNEQAARLSLQFPGVEVKTESYTRAGKVWYRLPFETSYVELTAGLTEDALQQQAAAIQMIQEQLKLFMKDYMSDFGYSLRNIADAGAGIVRTPQGDVSIQRIRVTMGEQETRDFIIYALRKLMAEEKLPDLVLQMAELAIASDPEARELMQVLPKEQLQEGIQEGITELQGLVENWDNGLDYLPVAISAALEFGLDSRGDIREYKALLTFRIPENGVGDDQSNGKDAISIQVGMTTTVYGINGTSPRLPTFTPANTITWREAWGGLLQDEPANPFSLLPLLGELEDPATTEQESEDSEAREHLVLIQVGNPVATIDGQVVVIGEAPYLKNGRLLAPVSLWEKAAQVSGIDITVETEKREGQPEGSLPGDISVYSYPPFHEIMFTADGRLAIVNNYPVLLDTGPEVRNGQVMLPLASVAEALELKISWDAEARTLQLVFPAIPD